ncbi:retroviral-like aspartic protease family protein [Hyphobacterium sp. HN65]|uniref:Retroviral-like aspartic protease family protein n=1 Tax=Hyphobacterium lacteum TaxID=3116575 RepID=A0ABU7LR41_9PROT|nr:retroviral-like aspartic protease family protein [Hyphobacterium sp. HN65]MEE2526384.1 retroviral-like aspartic protease family protein [Hyphobacterium sp. HN65]
MPRSSLFLTIAVIAGLSSACANATDTAHSSDIVFDSGGRPSARVVLNDQHEYLFAIDTAAQRTAISPQIVDELELVADPNNRAQAHGSAGVTYLDMYPITSVEIAGRRVENGLYMSAAAAHDESDIGHDGILGQEFFAGQRLIMDFEAREVAFGDVSANGLGEAIPVELMYGGFAVANIRINGVEVRALIDTGASTSFANMEMMAALGLDASDLAANEIRAGVTQQTSLRYTGFTGGIALGSVVIDEAPLEFTDSPTFSTFRMVDEPGVILGMDVLGRLPGFAIDYQTAEFRHLAE